MNKHIWVFMLLISSFNYPSDHKGEDDFEALLLGKDTHAYDNMDALHALKALYTARKILYVKGVSFDKDRKAIVARRRSYAKDGLQEWFISIAQDVECGNQEITSTTKIIDVDTGCFRQEHYQPDENVLSGLKHDIALFKLKFKQNRERHYYYWEVFDDTE